jgi:hypothetical protein
VKKKRFGNVFALEYRSGDSPLLPGFSITVDGDADTEFDGNWIRLREAKKLARDLQKAINYVEKSKAKK